MHALGLTFENIFDTNMFKVAYLHDTIWTSVHTLVNFFEHFSFYK